ncbi:MAG: hypothetical protein DME04_02320 [Candidatus Rokuibacteriota bacterium]|nr:MAG: hypothetical protein DME04_02320 [Candidatus Rokubacteria bacterium]
MLAKMSSRKEVMLPLDEGQGGLEATCAGPVLLLPRDARQRPRRHDEREEDGMARIKHIALTTGNPDEVAAFYKAAFGWKEIRRSPSGAVFLTDGAINLAILNWKTDQDADVGANGPNYSGIHHFGVEVDDLGDASRQLEAAQGKRLTQKEGIDAPLPSGRHRNFEMKWAGPDEVVFDISHTGWDGTS